MSAPALAAPPPNDDFANATELAKLPSTLPYDTTEATSEFGEPDTGPGSKTVWYRLVAPLNGSYAAETIGPTALFDADPVINVYSGTCATPMNALTFVAQNDDGGADFNALAGWTGVAGTVYWVQIRNFNGAPATGSAGDVKFTGPGFSTLNSCTPPPPNCPGTVLVGTNGNDTYTGGSQPNSYNGLGGMDSISGGSMDDLLCGGAGADTISGGSGNDDLYGDGGPDNISGGSGTDDIVGGAGADVVTAGGDADDIFLVDGAGNDKVDCGSGFDTVHLDPGDQATSNCESINP